jgi:hypothetical protein
LKSNMHMELLARSATTPAVSATSTMRATCRLHQRHPDVAKIEAGAPAQRSTIQVSYFDAVARLIRERLRVEVRLTWWWRPTCRRCSSTSAS